MKRLAIVGVAVLLLGATIVVGKGKTDFSGVWNQDATLSEVAPHPEEKGGGGNTTATVAEAIPNVLGGRGGMGGMMGGGMIGGFGGRGGGMGGMMGGGGFGGMGGGGLGSLITSGARITSSVSGSGRGTAKPVVPDIGIGVPVGKSMEIKQTEDEIQITHKGLPDGKDVVEKFRLKGKAAIDEVGTEGGTRLKRKTEVKLGKNKLEIKMTTKLPNKDERKDERVFTLDEAGNGMAMKLTISQKKYTTLYQSVVYNKE
jgi:hypothetical protein